jgi:uncharacterized protein
VIQEPAPPPWRRAGALLRGSRTIPRTRLTARRIWRPTVGSLISLLLGLALFGSGEAFLLAADLGASPWTVLAQGLSIRLGTNVGTMTFVISLVVLLLWIPLRQKPGLGTVTNIIGVSVSLQLVYDVLPRPSVLGVQLVFVVAGVMLIGLGSGFYLTAGHGPGPRDGWMTGMHHRTGWPVGRIRLLIEVTVLVVGVLLGGTFGVGTVIFALFIGQSVALGLQVVAHLFPPVPHETVHHEPPGA